MGAQCIDWPGLSARIALIDDALHASGIGQGATVAVLGRNDLPSAVAILTLVATGRCAAIVNPFRSGEAVLDSARRTSAAAMILAEDEPTLRCAEGSDTILVLSDDGSFRGDARIAGRGTLLRGPHDGIMISTSGTTGVPKSHHIPLTTLSRALVEIEAFNAGFGDRRKGDGQWPSLIQYSSLSHIAGALTLLRGAAQGRQTIVMRKFDAEVWASIVEEWQPYTTGLPPSMMRMVLEADIASERLSSLVSVWSGSAPVRAEDREGFTARYGLPVLGNYGATEFCGAIAAWSLDDYREFGRTRSMAVGRIDRRNTEVRVIGADGTPCTGFDHAGVLEFRLARIGNQWIRTSDIGSIDRDDFLTLHGRKDDAILRGGFKLSPGIIADMIRSHPLVRDVAVVGLPDSRLGEVPVAALELHESAALSQEEVRDYVRSRLPAYFVPAKVRTVAALPRNAAMKLDRRAIVELFED
ncbi:fatty acid--CoA ligase family protein [Croceicoccus sp. BE223]|uniref:class I adenylate-forming enzyme family protein n=1 Tax=Croceicoccus sp. BE223 TaxID=2817716 RepID=UPI002861ADB2|nr:fatty acid--CoA ligase family protein [Croceicoccus sp. BE223]MDR7103734.1 acyl-CoA synthetase (AMP-forming)/AMP-acid ligase II [Croceicoccus sp. BE223]